MDITFTLHNYQWYSGKRSWLWPFPVASRGGTGARCMWNRYVFALVWLIITSAPILTSLSVKGSVYFLLGEWVGLNSIHRGSRINTIGGSLKSMLVFTWDSIPVQCIQTSHKMTIQSPSWLYGYSMNEDILLHTDRAISIAMSSSSELLNPRSTLCETSLT